MNMSNYIRQDFEDDKTGYRRFYQILATCGTDEVYSRFLKLAKRSDKDYWLLLLDDMIVELTGLFQSMLMERSGKYNEILEKIKAP
jgi:hypothetical protein